MSNSANRQPRQCLRGQRAEVAFAHLLSFAVLSFSLLSSLLILTGCEEAYQPQASTPVQTTNEGAPRSTAADSAATDSAAAQTTETDAEPAPSGKLIRASFDDLEIDLEKGAPFDESLLTPKIKALEGKRIRIRGFMLGTFRKSGIKDFVLIRDNQECCFGPGAYLYHCVLVRMQGDATAEYGLLPITVEGTFHYEEYLDPVSGNHLAIYAIDAERAE